MRSYHPLLILLFTSIPILAKAEEISPEQLDYFETNVRPALVKYCYECHSAEAGESRGGLYLDTRDGMRDGGSTGPLFEGEYPLFVDAITWADSDFEMPPKQKMPEDVIEALLKWVEMGAPDPRVRETVVVETEIDIEAGKNHWSYKRPIRPAEKSIDQIVEKRRSAEGLHSVEEADSLSLLRRLNFDLVGLPPTPPQVQAFYQAIKEDRAAAIEKKVDELMASEHFGERWGRHWLDVVRFGESSGTLNIVYPYAWRFRNYVIDAFNKDKPYDRIITEHLAGDLLPASSEQQKQEHLIATGFLAVGPKKQNEKNREVFRMNLIDEQIDTTTRGFLATTVACARCHDHKFDPIPTTDYYAMAGIFKSTETLWGTIAGNQNHRTSALLALPISDQKLGQENQGSEFETKQKELADLIARNNELRGRDGKGKGSKGGKGKGKGTPSPDSEGDGETKSRSEMLAELGMEKKDLVRLKQKIMRLESELKFLNPDGSAKTFGMGAREGFVGNCNVLVTGDINKPAQEVERGFPQVLQISGTPTIPAEDSGRLQLAQWITSANNPLTARVMVNRIWMHLTGAPIVETMDNFGTTGLPPSNQELLDYLAIRFMERGWSVKQLIREIVLSKTYQLASTYHEENFAKDPANATFWRASPRQLDAEALRDQMLVVSGLLDRKRPESSMAMAMGDSRIKDRGKDTITGFDTSQFRGRSLYLPIMRDSLPDELGLFDFPNPQATIGQRNPTNVAPQSLYLLNSEVVYVQARAMAEVLERNFASPHDQVAKAFLLCFNRPASKEEINRGQLFLREFDPGSVPDAQTPSPAADEPATGKKGKKGGKKGKGGKKAPIPEEEIPNDSEPTLSAHQTKLTAFCQALMMSAEFRTIH